MRHKKGGVKLGRTSSHRKAMFRNMARSLLTYGHIKTTEAKAKELRKVADGLVTLGLRGDLHARRLAYKVLENHQLVKKAIRRNRTALCRRWRRLYSCVQAQHAPGWRLRPHGRYRTDSLGAGFGRSTKLIT